MISSSIGAAHAALVLAAVTAAFPNLKVPKRLHVFMNAPIGRHARSPCPRFREVGLLARPSGAAAGFLELTGQFFAGSWRSLPGRELDEPQL